MSKCAYEPLELNHVDAVGTPPQKLFRKAVSYRTIESEISEYELSSRPSQESEQPSAVRTASKSLANYDRDILRKTTKKLSWLNSEASSLDLDFAEKNLSPVSDMSRKHSRTLQIAANLLGRQKQFRSKKRRSSEFRTLASQWRKGRFVLDPRQEFLSKWDTLVWIAVQITAFLPPFEFGFFLPKYHQKIFWAERLLDVIFVVDTFLRFCRMYHSAEEMRWIEEAKVIAWNYLRQDFIFHLVGALPVDLLVFGFPWHEWTQEGNIDLWRILLLTRMINFVRLPRLWRDRQLSHQPSGRSAGFSTIAARIPRITARTAWFAHMMACFWGFLGQVSPRYGWTKGTISVEQEPHYYMVCFYWSVMTITSIGYGDIVPETDIECIFCTVFMSLGAIFWVYAIGTICGVIATLDAKNTEKLQTTDELEFMMQNADLPDATRRELRWFFFQKQSSAQISKHLELLEGLSPSLQAAVARSQMGPWVSQVPYIQDITQSPQVAIQLRHLLQDIMFCPEEVMHLQNSLCMIRRGLALKGLFLVLISGAVWGQADALLTSQHLLDPDVPVAISFVEVLHLPKYVLDALALNFPQAREKLRRARLRYLWIRGIKYASRQLSKKEGTPWSLAFHESQSRSQRLSVQSRSLREHVSVDMHISQLEASHVELNGKIDRVESLIKKMMMTDCLSHQASNEALNGSKHSRGYKRRPSQASFYARLFSHGRAKTHGEFSTRANTPSSRHPSSNLSTKVPKCCMGGLCGSSPLPAASPRPSDASAQDQAQDSAREPSEDLAEVLAKDVAKNPAQDPFT